MSNELYHYGVGHKDGGHSGRYPWGSGNNPYQDSWLADEKFQSVKGNLTFEKSKTTILAKVLARLSPTIQKNIRDYRDYYIYDKNNKKIGNLSVNHDANDEMNIVWLGINSKQQGQGYGTEAMKTIIDKAKKEGIKRVTLEVPGNAPNAQHIYEKLGFKLGERISDEDDVWGGLTKMTLDLDKKEFYHYGVGHKDGGHSGRYEWGSGERIYQRTNRETIRESAKKASNKPRKKKKPSINAVNRAKEVSNLRSSIAKAYRERLDRKDTVEQNRAKQWYGDWWYDLYKLNPLRKAQGAIADRLDTVAADSKKRVDDMISQIGSESVRYERETGMYRLKKRHRKSKNE